MTKKRAVITGMGSISCIGNNLEEISNSLRQGISGISKNDEYNDLGFRSKVSGSISIDLKDLIDRKLFRFMGEAAAYSYLSALDALRDSELPESIFETDRIGVIAGSGAPEPAITPILSVSKILSGNSESLNASKALR